MMLNHSYKGKFYSEREQKTKYAANIILNEAFHLIEEIDKNISISSIVDVGCGVGVWLKEAEKKGVTKLLGFEGDWLPKNEFVSSADLITANFEETIQSLHQYDLAISLEVAEHISEANAQRFVNDLASLSDIVLFSAAPPGQGGRGHVNEQPQSYWRNLFSNQGYVCIDKIRANIWDDEEIDFWYRQNICLYISEKIISEKQANDLSAPPVDVIHPSLFNTYRYPGLYLSINNALRILPNLLNKIIKVIKL